MSTCQERIMPSSEREPFFSLGGLKNFFISMSSQKESKEGRMPLKMAKNALACERSLPCLIRS